MNAVYVIEFKVFWNTGMIETVWLVCVCPIYGSKTTGKWENCFFRWIICFQNGKFDGWQISHGLWSSCDASNVPNADSSWPHVSEICANVLWQDLCHFTGTTTLFSRFIISLQVRLQFICFVHKVEGGQFTVVEVYILFMVIFLYMYAVSIITIVTIL